MKEVNVKVVVNNNGEIVVKGLNKKGSESAVQYTVQVVEGLREFALKMMKAGIDKQASIQIKKEDVTVKQAPAKAKDVKADTKNKVYTKGQQFSNFRKVGERAVKFDIADKGECIIGFAKDRNAFMEAFNGTIREITRNKVIQRLAKYQGHDARELVKIVNTLKPVDMSADICTCCGAKVTPAVKEYSTRKFGKVLCRSCQHTPKSKTSGKAASEASRKPQAPKVKDPDDISACLNCGTEVEHYTFCLACHKKLEAEERNAYYEDTCACGNHKERAYEQCEECRSNSWSESDSNQLSLLEDKPSMDFSLEDLEDVSEEEAEANYERIMKKAIALGYKPKADKKPKVKTPSDNVDTSVAADGRTSKASEGGVASEASNNPEEVKESTVVLLDEDDLSNLVG